MGEYLVIRADLLAAADMLEVLGDPKLLCWEEDSHCLDVLARWLPKKGFKILPKLFDASYRPGTVKDDGDRLITNVGGCHLRSEDGEEPMPIWNSSVLVLPQVREELRRIIEENVLDMSFEEEIVKELKRIFGKAYYEVDEKKLEEDNKSLRNFAKILMRLVECVDQIRIKREKEGWPSTVDFEFYIPRY